MKEVWKDIKGYEGKYQISNQGRVKSLIFSNRQATFKKERILKQRDNTNYYQVSLSKNNVVKQYLIHRLVAEAFIENPDNLPCVNHKDGNKKNNNINNLEWCNYSYNTKHSYNIGLQRVPKGENHWSYGKPSKKRKKIKQYDLKENLIKIWSYANEIEKELGINANNIRNCCRGNRPAAGGYIWRYVNDKI